MQYIHVTFVIWGLLNQFYDHYLNLGDSKTMEDEVI
jgi:hypothetical protein